MSLLPRRRAALFIRTVGAVLASFIGIRKKASLEKDATTIKPLHVIVAGIIGAAMFVTILVTLVRFITRS